MSTYGAFQTDASLETAGIVLDFGQAGRVRIARAGGANAGYKKAMQRLTKPHRRAIQLGTLPDDTFDDIVRQAYAEAVVLGWENVTDADGNDLPFSKANAIKLFTDLPEFFNEIAKAADKASLFRVDQLEGDAKNS